jgi:hypothetical protein
MTAALPGSEADADLAPPLRLRGSAVIYRLYDVGFEIDLGRALERLRASAPERVRPVRREAQAIQIANPPITVLLAQEPIVIGELALTAEVSARIFDFGVVSVRARIAAPGELTWAGFGEFGMGVESSVDIPALCERHLQLLRDRMGDAVERPALAPVSEEYVVYRTGEVLDESGRRLLASELVRLDVAPLLLNESRPLSAEARRELLPHRFTYYTDDLAILTWENALIVDPSDGDTDVMFVLEFANAQLLELRYYDALLDAELPRMYTRVAALRTQSRVLLTRRFAPLLADLQSLVAESTELVERVENALKVTDDVYLARVYSAALEIFRGRVWRSGIDRKLTIIRETYGMLNADSQAGRAELLELTIVLLIVMEIVMAFFR